MSILTSMRNRDGSLTEFWQIALCNPSGRLHRQRRIICELAVRLTTYIECDCAAALARLRDQIVPILEAQTIKSLAGEDTLQCLATWIKTRLQRAGTGPLVVLYVQIHEPATQGFVRVDWTARRGRAGTIPLTPTEEFLNSVLVHEMRGRFFADERFTTRYDRRRIVALFGSTEPAPLVTILCPPYVCTPAGYVSVHDNFADEPLSYGFDYPYKKYVTTLVRLADDAARYSVHLRPIVVLGDWALINIENIRRTVGNDDSIRERLGRFLVGLEQFCARQNSLVEVTSFQRLGVSGCLPIGFPSDATSKLAWLRQQMRQRPAWFPGAEIAALLKTTEDDEQLQQYLSRQYDYRLLAEVKSRQDAINILIVFKNIYLIEQERAGRPPTLNPRALDPHQASALRRSAYIDAILRFVQYRLYANFVTETFGPSICCYQDDGLTACGNFFRLPDMPVLFFNPNHLVGLPKPLELRHPA